MLPPNVNHPPRETLETFKPLLPNRLYSIELQLTPWGLLGAEVWATLPQRLEVMPSPLETV